MQLVITPGIDRMYRLAVVDGPDFITLSEHDTPAAVIAARREIERVCNDAADQLQRIAA